jgi:hypothetical protein
MADDIRVAPSSEPSIPADLKDAYENIQRYAPQSWSRTEVDRAFEVMLIERIGRAEDRIAEPKWLVLPNEQAWWWYWNGENYMVPHIFSVMVSNTGTPRYFIQYPDSRWCDEIGGWWLKVEYPNVPSREYIRAALAAPSGVKE